MNPKTLRNELIREIKFLPAKDVSTVAEFVNFIRERELEDEILNSKKLLGAVKRSRAAWKNQKMTEFVSWEALKKKYKI